MKKERIKKNLVFLLKEIKRVLYMFIVYIKKFFIKLWNKFMELPKKVRLIICLWTMVVIVLLLFISIANGTKQFYNKYDDFEKKISALALKYVKDKNIYTTKDNKLKINLEILKEENYINSADIIDASCEGISVVYYDDVKEEYVVDSYLNCKNYTSKNYWDYK